MIVKSSQTFVCSSNNIHHPPEAGDPGLVLGEVGPDVLLPGRGQLAVREPAAPRHAEVLERVGAAHGEARVAGHVSRVHAGHRPARLMLWQPLKIHAYKQYKH